MYVNINFDVARSVGWHQTERKSSMGFAKLNYGERDIRAVSLYRVDHSLMKLNFCPFSWRKSSAYYYLKCVWHLSVFDLYNLAYKNIHCIHFSDLLQLKTTIGKKKFASKANVSSQASPSVHFFTQLEIKEARATTKVGLYLRPR